MAKSVELRAAELLDFVRQEREATDDWIAVHNLAFGINGKFLQLFPDERERVQAGKTDAFQKAWKMVGELRAAKGDPDSLKGNDSIKRANGNIAIRLPSSLHAALLAEADLEGCSLNQLIAVKLAMQLGACVKK